MEKAVKYTLIGVSIAIAGIGGYVLLRNFKRSNGNSKFNKSLVNNALSEWESWNKGFSKEGDIKTMNNLRRYWREGANINNWSDSKMVNEAWSAAFISYLMKISGAGNDFKYSPSHSVYIREAIKNRALMNSNPFKAYAPFERKVSKGDLICYARQGGVDYNTTSSYKSHCDLVVSVNKDKASVIGGNVSDTVTKGDVELTGSGKLKDRKYFVIIKNNK